jgi:hypothetical protein
MARNLTDTESGMLRVTRHLIVDRDAKYSGAFRALLVRAGVDVIRLPPQHHFRRASGSRDPAPRPRHRLPARADYGLRRAPVARS